MEKGKTLSFSSFKVTIMRIGTGFLVSMAFQVSHVHMYSVYDICIQIKKFKKQQKYVIP